MRIGIFGGTFDPVHLGHLILAEHGREQGRLDQVWFVPSARPPHKLSYPITPFRQRVEMLRLALASHSPFRVEDSEAHRAGPSYTVDTLEELNRRHPGNEWFLLLGSDSLVDLPGWYNPAGIVQRASLLVMNRPGAPVPPLEILKEAFGLSQEGGLHCQVIEVPLIDLASRDLRARAAAGRSLRYLVPRAVECYIKEHNLYQSWGPSVSEPVSQ
jgi:nicotinate-nucleotide adenylyltransferase